MKTTSTALTGLVLLVTALAGCTGGGGAYSAEDIRITVHAPPSANASEPTTIEWTIDANEDAGVDAGASGGNGSASANATASDGTVAVDSTALYWSTTAVDDPDMDSYANKSDEQSGQAPGSFSTQVTFDAEGTYYLRAHASIQGAEAWSEEVTIQVGGDNASGSNQTVTIRQAPVGALSGYEPATLTVSVGEAVVWENEDDEVHTATAADGSFDTGDIAAGNMSEAVVFDTAGEFAYQCTYHGQTMKGTIVVEDA